jgi:hypothetical protein
MNGLRFQGSLVAGSAPARSAIQAQSPRSSFGIFAIKPSFFLDLFGLTHKERR